MQGSGGDEQGSGSVGAGTYGRWAGGGGSSVVTDRDDASRRTYVWRTKASFSINPSNRRSSHIRRNDAVKENVAARHV
jgi:hypothetical protein